MTLPIGGLTYNSMAVAFWTDNAGEERMDDVGDWYEDEAGQMFVLMSRDYAQYYKNHPEFKGRIITKRGKEE